MRHQDEIKASDRVKVKSEYSIHYPFGGSSPGGGPSGCGGCGTGSASGYGGSSSGAGGSGSGRGGNNMRNYSFSAATGSLLPRGRGGLGSAFDGGLAAWALEGGSAGLGLWLETDVANDCVVVKRVKPKSYADVEEDVRPGDQVLGVGSRASGFYFFSNKKCKLNFWVIDFCGVCIFFEM
jgi:hypothetical protein